MLHNIVHLGGLLFSSSIEYGLSMYVQYFTVINCEYFKTSYPTRSSSIDDHHVMISSTVSRKGGIYFGRDISRHLSRKFDDATNLIELGRHTKDILA